MRTYRLVQDRSTGANAVTVSCVRCNARERLSDVFADLNGEAFVDYYCEPCAKMYATDAELDEIKRIAAERRYREGR